MHRRTTRLNRVLFVVIGLALLAAAAFLLARHYDLIDTLPSDDRLYSRSQSRWLHGHEWIWFVVAGVAIVVGLGALRWLLVQPRLDRLGTLRLDLLPNDDPTDAAAGRTTLAADALTDAIEDDVTGYPAVARVRVLLVGTVREPEIIVRVSARAGGDIPTMHKLIAEDALDAARTALGVDDTRAQVHLLIAGEGTDDRIVR